MPATRTRTKRQINLDCRHIHLSKRVSPNTQVVEARTRGKKSNKGSILGESTPTMIPSTVLWLEGRGPRADASLPVNHSLALVASVCWLIALKPVYCTNTSCPSLGPVVYLQTLSSFCVCSSIVYLHALSSFSLYVCGPIFYSHALSTIIFLGGVWSYSLLTCPV